MSIEAQELQDVNQVQVANDIPRNKNGNIDWLKLKDDPELLASTLESEAQRFIAGGAHLSQLSLVRSGMISLRHAISHYYPGGFVALKEKLGVSLRVPNDYSKIVATDENGVPKDQRGRIFLAVLKDKPEELVSTIETEAIRLMSEGIEITGNSLSAHRLSGFTASIQRYYPGGMRSLRERLGNPVEQRPNGYWHDSVNIEKEARALADQGNTLTQRELSGIRMGTLSNAIREHYPGGLSQLRVDLGINPVRQPRGKWQTPQAIESEIEQFLAQGNKLSQESLNQAGLSGLVDAIRNRYPGGILAIRDHFGLPTKQRPAGFWRDLANIEAEARKLVEAGNPLTQSALAEAGMSSMSDAIRKYYPGGINQLRINMGLEIVKRDIGYWTVKQIENEALEFFQQEGNLSGDSLTHSGRQALLGAINAKYPGRMRQLKINLGIEPASKPEGYWTPEQIRFEAGEFHQQEGSLLHPLLHEKGRKDLATAITRKYLGGMRQLQIDLGLQPTRKDNYWTPEKVEEEAWVFIDQNGSITQKSLTDHGRNDLSGAITNHYPGGLRRLKEKLGIEMSKPPGYWTPERIEQDAVEIYQKLGTLTQEELTKNHHSDLIHAIREYYQGGMFELRKKLGLEIVQRPAGYWNIQTIEEEALRLFKGLGDFHSGLLDKRGATGLAAAIPRHYPGGMRALREKLGLPSLKPAGYWKDPANIEAEVRKLLESGVPLSQRMIYQAGMSTLSNAISKYYPGGMEALKEKLGLTEPVQQTISSDEANEQLRRLIEE